MVCSWVLRKPTAKSLASYLRICSRFARYCFRRNPCHPDVSRRRTAIHPFAPLGATDDLVGNKGGKGNSLFSRGLHLLAELFESRPSIRSVSSAPISPSNSAFASAYRAMPCTYRVGSFLPNLSRMTAYCSPPIVREPETERRRSGLRVPAAPQRRRGAIPEPRLGGAELTNRKQQGG
jgi:hypothetical protein